MKSFILKNKKTGKYCTDEYAEDTEINQALLLGSKSNVLQFLKHLGEDGVDYVMTEVKIEEIL